MAGSVGRVGHRRKGVRRSCALGRRLGIVAGIDVGDGSLMIPRLPTGPAPGDIYLDFLGALPEAGFAGDVAPDYARRLVGGTDNSVYQLLPQAVVYPRTADDVQVVLALLAEPRFRAITVTPRGGGTGTNGQSLTEGLLLDLSRHLDRILEVDLEAGVARVEPGVVLDQLNDHLAPHGVFFAPDLSPSSRATIGGMISTDAAGRGSRVYGKTSEHVVALDVVLVGGHRHTCRAIDGDALTVRAAESDPVGRVHGAVDRILTENADAIAATYPDLRRFMTGYDLVHARPAGGGLDLRALFCGAEGTLGVVVEATVALTPIPTHSRLVVLGYRAFEHALASAEELVERDPSAIETIDQMVLGLARQDAIWPRVAGILKDSDGLAAVNLVEFSGTDRAAVDKKVEQLVASLGRPAKPEHAPITWVTASNQAEADALWALRKKGVGLLGNAPGPRKPVPFVEDTVVPPGNLRAYIAEFRALLDAEGLRYGMFGHIDVGCLHVRPALDMRDPEDEARLKRISDGVCALVQKYGGLIWGEHGKGMRSAYSPRFFGPVWPALKAVKRAFDPHDQLNPGKIATAEAPLVSIDAPTRGQRDRQIDARDHQRFGIAVACNGNGACYDYQPDHVMCPSSKITRDRIHSPKGRAGLMREWLRLLAETGQPLAADGGPGGLLTRARNSWSSAPDFSHEVYDAMHGCLSCKACATHCPVKVDVPSFKADFLQAYYGRYLRPLRDHLVGLLETTAPWAAAAPRLSNALARTTLARWALRRFAGIVDPPAFSHPTARASLRRRRARPATARALAALGPDARSKAVVLVPDAFSFYFDAPAFVACYDLVVALGYTAYVAPFVPNGKGLHVKGFLDRFARTARRNVDALRPLAETGVELIGVDPAVVLTYRDEYLHALGDGSTLPMMLIQDWLAERLDEVRAVADGRPVGPRWTLMAHCTERTASAGAEARWQQAFEAAGLPLDAAAVGCCGMCGIYGHEADHVAESEGIFRMSWAPRLAEAGERVVADGYSCRSQIDRFDARTVPHPARVLADRLTADR